MGLKRSLNKLSRELILERVLGSVVVSVFLIYIGVCGFSISHGIVGYSYLLYYFQLSSCFLLGNSILYMLVAFYRNNWEVAFSCRLGFGTVNVTFSWKLDREPLIWERERERERERRGLCSIWYIHVYIYKRAFSTNLSNFVTV